METIRESSNLFSHGSNESRMILLVEDEEASRNHMLDALRSEGYKVIDASNGLKALALYIEHRESIDLVITEVKTPQMSGWELASRIKSIQPETKLLLISAYKHSETLTPDSGELDMAFLQKPFTLPALISKIEALFGHHQIQMSENDNALLLI